MAVRRPRPPAAGTLPIRASMGSGFGRAHGGRRRASGTPGSGGDLHSARSGVSRRGRSTLTKAMNENEDLIARFRALGRRPVGPDVADRHLAAMAAASDGAPPVAGRHRLRIVAAFAVGVLAGTSGLATAGALPNGAQEVAHRTLGA